MLVSMRPRQWYPLRCREIVGPKYFAARRVAFLATAPGTTVFHGFVCLRRGVTPWAPGSTMGAWHLRVQQALSEVTLTIRSSAGIRSSCTYTSPMWLSEIPTARTSGVGSSMPGRLLREARRPGLPCLQAYHSPSPSTPVLPAARQGVAHRCTERDSAGTVDVGATKQDVHGQRFLARR